MVLDLSCPLELIHYELVRDDRNKLRAYLSLNNLAPSRIRSIEGDILWLSQGVRDTSPFAADGLNAPASVMFKLQLSIEDSGADGVELVPRRIVYEDGSPDWSLDEDNLIEVELPKVPSGQDLNLLLKAAGQDARNFPEDAGSLWICVCGRPNGNDTPECVRCGRAKAHVLGQLNRRTVLAGRFDPSDDVPAPEIPTFLFEKEPEKSKRQLQKERIQRELRQMERTYHSQRRMHIRRSMFMAGLVVLALLLAYVFEWLTAKEQQAREMRPPVRIEDMASMETDAQPTIIPAAPSSS